MVCDGYTKVWDLVPDELVRLDGARGTTLRITRGTVWITLEDDTRDVVLTAGDAFTIDRRGAGALDGVRDGPAHRRSARAQSPTGIARACARLAAIGRRRHGSPLRPLFLGDEGRRPGSRSQRRDPGGERRLVSPWRR